MKTLTLVLLLVVIWAAGLWAFAARIADSTPATDPPRADGVVALTGASSLRIEAATELLEQGLGQRLLISGVNREATRAQVRDTTTSAGRAFDCCVDLGFEAENTLGNAHETAGWARYHHYRSLIVVTGDYHMPRAIQELHAAMPGVALYPYPVASQSLDAHRWWATPSAARRMALEYCKYLAVLGRNGLSGLHHRGGDAPERTRPGPTPSENATENTAA
ncbi:YdcF family protein [Caulobacter sp. S45]|uniref:YdcF family protein n=1 Tax=Caulobacter sp. S45 TaxID=1641861 RepID=UPI00131D27E7|nr:YdcF family protein [Caulobacter sp. S45]